MALSPELQQKMNALLESALKLDPAERSSFLNRACAGNPSLRQEVETRLVAHAKTPVSDDVSSARQSKSQPDTGVVVGELISHYKIVSFLGRGGMGEVYLAQDSRLGRKVALKLLPKALSNDEERLRRFEREARSASALSHPNVCVIHEIGETAEGRPYISMEYIDGETLRRRFGRGPLKLREAIDIAQQTASALAAAHEAGVVHRDIKPENIMLRRDGYVKVLDFGLAKLTERYEGGSDSEAPTFHIFSTHSGVLLGTTNYLSPEQARRLEVDERADIWALGVVLYEMITGRLPFTGETPSHIIVSILEKEPESLTHFLPQAPTELQWIVRKALRKNPEHRYQTIKEFAGDIDEMKQKILDSAVSGAAPIASLVPTQPSTRHSSALQSISQTLRRPRLSIAALAVVMIFVGLLGWLLVQRLRIRSAPLFENLEVTKLTNSGNVTDATISPDGKYVVYVADEQGKQSLWFRHVPTASNVVIIPPDSVDYEGLTFSRDSNYVYYVRREKDQIGVLYEVPVVGGATRKLLRNVDSAVTYSPDGKRFAFIRHDQPKTNKVIISDGVGEQELAAADQTEVFASPSWSPDDTMIAYAVGNYSGGYHMTLVATGISGSGRKVISSRPWYSIRRVSWLGDSSGLIVNASEQPYGAFQMWRVAYPSGTVERITNDLNNYLALGLTAGADTVVTVKSDRSANIWLAALNDTPRARKLMPEVGTYFGVSWFPDGRLAVSSMGGGNPDIWVINSDGRGQKQLTSNNGANYHPAVSRDGRYIVFTGYRGGAFNIWRMDADGSNQVQLTKGDFASFPTWTPDGQWVYYSVLAGGNATLWKVSTDGRGQPVAVTNYYSRGPVVSPDGRLISCTYWDGKTGSLRYAVIPAEGGAPIKLFGNPDPNGQRLLRWTPDSQALFYVDMHDGNSNIWSQPLNASPAKQVTTFDSDQVFGFDLSPDGRQLVITRGTTVSDVVLMRGLKKST
jgi:serine/threonine protein kinase/Tol biopolymer transport system component